MNKLKELRKKKNLSQSELADAVGLSNQVISFYENDKRNRKIENWYKLADFFSVPVSYLLNSDDKNEDEIYCLINDYMSRNKTKKLARKYVLQQADTTEQELAEDKTKDPDSYFELKEIIDQSFFNYLNDDFWSYNKSVVRIYKAGFLKDYDTFLVFFEMMISYRLAWEGDTFENW